jgi:hypothetical protein
METRYTAAFDLCGKPVYVCTVDNQLQVTVDNQLEVT